MAGDLAHRNGYAGVTSHFAAAGSIARAELAMNQDKNRLQLRRSGSPVNQARSFKFTACAVSDLSTLSPRSAAIVPGRRSVSPVLRGLKVGEIMSVLRDRSPIEERGGESLGWPHRRGDEGIPSNFSGFQWNRSSRARSASPPRGRKSGPEEEGRMVALFAAVSAEQEVEAAVVHKTSSPKVPLSPRVRESDWLEGLSSRRPERGGSRLFPTHLAKSTPAPTGGSKPGGAFVVSGGPQSAKVKTVPKTETQPAQMQGGHRSQRSPKAKAKAVVNPKAATKSPTERQGAEKDKEVQSSAPKNLTKKSQGDRGNKAERKSGPSERTENVEHKKDAKADPAKPLDGPKSKESSSPPGLSKLQLLRKRLDDTMRAAEGVRDLSSQET